MSRETQSLLITTALITIILILMRRKSKRLLLCLLVCQRLSSTTVLYWKVSKIYRVATSAPPYTAHRLSRSSLLTTCAPLWNVQVRRDQSPASTAERIAPLPSESQESTSRPRNEKMSAAAIYFGVQTSTPTTATLLPPLSTPAGSEVSGVMISISPCLAWTQLPAPNPHIL